MTLSKRAMMQASSIIQNPRVMPRTITAEDVVLRGRGMESPLSGVPVPRTVREVEGMSRGVMKAERTEGESA